MKNKEQVFDDFIKMICNSWTYGKMTKEEKETCLNVLSSYRTIHDIKGTYIQRWKALNTVYYAFIMGLGYSDFTWRESK